MTKKKDKYKVNAELAKRLLLKRSVCKFISLNGPALTLTLACLYDDTLDLLQEQMTEEL